jgi:CheY-like chemotaxis protein
MAKTLLAVDDSVTMRKVVEMTFAGEDVRVLAVASAQEALAACRRERPDAVLADVALEGGSGYDLCRSLKEEFGRLPVVLLASKQNPFDPSKGQASGADAHLDKPYDTAKAIELVKGVMTKAPTAPPPTPVPQATRPPMFTAPKAAPVTPVPPPLPPAVHAPLPAPHPTMQGLPAAGRSPLASDRAATPALKPQSTARMASDAPPAASVGALPAELPAQLRDLGLTGAQIDAVLALSREVVERVVWEVVPTLAETLIKEELARLTRDG